jgi:hypothetical protein
MWFTNFTMIMSPFYFRYPHHVTNHTLHCRSTFRHSVCQPLPNFSGTAVAYSLMCCSTNRKVAGSIPAGVSGSFNDKYSFRSHYGLGSTQPIREKSTRNISCGKVGRCVSFTNYHHCAVVTKSVNLEFPNPLCPPAYNVLL